MTVCWKDEIQMNVLIELLGNTFLWLQWSLPAEPEEIGQEQSWQLLM